MYKIEKLLGLAGVIIAIVAGVIETVDFFSNKGHKELPEPEDA